MPAPIKLELEIEDTNLILEALGKLPFVTVYQLIARIQGQAQAQVQAAQGAAPASEGEPA
jgi:hypothetical protein